MEGNNNNAIPTMEYICGHEERCQMKTATQNHNCAKHGAYILRRCPNSPFCTANANKPNLRGYFNVRKWKKHVEKCMLDRQNTRDGSDHRGKEKEDKMEDSTIRIALVLSETYWVHEWSYIVQAYFNSRVDFPRVRAFLFKFTDEQNFKEQLKKQEPQLERFDKIIFVLAGDGLPGQIQINVDPNGNLLKVIPVANILRVVASTFGTRLVCIQLSSCSIMKGNPAFLEEFQIATVGYGKQVFWNDSALVDLCFLQNLLELGADVQGAFDAVVRNMPPLVEKTQFTVWLPFLVESKKKRGRREFTVATVGSGVEVKESGLQNAGNGLFATKDFKSRDWITEYCGEKLNLSEAEALKKENNHWYLKDIQFGLQFIDGLKDPNKAISKGLGGGSFANDNRKQPNAMFESVYMEAQKRFIIVLTAVRDIHSGEEIFVDYGSRYWKDWENNYSQTAAALDD